MRVYASFDMSYVRIRKTSYDMGDRIHLSYERKELVAKPLPFMRILYKPCDIDKFYCGRDGFCGFHEGLYLGKPFIRDRDYSKILALCTKGVIGYFSSSMRKRVKKR